MENIIPEIKRSRGYLIYDTKGKRYLDFYQDSGRAVLGHRIEGVTRVIKSTVARGLTTNYPSVYKKRIQKELDLIFPYVSEFRVYRNMERAMSALSLLEGEEISIDNFIDFPTKESRYGIWRPFLGSDLNWKGFDFFIPVLPFPGDFGPVVLAVNNVDQHLMPSDDLSPMVSDMLIKSIVSLIHHSKNTSLMDMSVFESSLWERIGPYLRFKLEVEDYSLLFRKALERSVLLPPFVNSPGIIPFHYEEGQIKGFMQMVKQFLI